MDKNRELEFFEEISEEIGETLEQVTHDLELEQKQIKKLKEYINDQYGAMDVKELRANVEDVGAMVSLADADSKRERNLKFLKASPYFAKIKFTPDGSSNPTDIYIGTGGFWSEKDKRAKIYDWRAPVSALYYDYDLGRGSYKVVDTTGPSPSVTRYEGEITEKYQYNIKDGKMLYMADTGQRISDDLLLKALSGNAPEKMKPVVATIQKEQNEIIRNISAKELVVDGRAGSGKTVIAMHRLAWLLYNKRKTLNTGNVLVLSPNNIFSDYVSSILPELMENPVPEKQWDDLMDELVFIDMEHESRLEQADVILAAEPDPARIRNIKLKTSIAFFDAFEEYIDKVFIGQTGFKDFHYEKMTFPKEKLEKYFFGNFSSLPPYERYYNIAYFIMEEFQYENKKDYSENRREKMQRHIQNQLIHQFSERNIVKIYRDFLEVVSSAFPGAENFTDEQGRISYEDMQAIFYLQIKLYGCNTYKDLKHCVIDEMQDYSVFQFAVMKMIFGGSKTILGDRFQVLLPDEEENVLDVIIRIFPDRTLKILNKTYRSTEEISMFCNSILGEECEARPYARHGKAPEVCIAGSEEEQISLLKNKLTELKNSGYDSVAVLCDDEGCAYEVFRTLDDPEIRFLSERNAGYRGGIGVMSRFLAKGMEFDAVCVVSGSSTDTKKMSSSDLNAYYISCTRALHELYVFGIE
ncbi:MAG: HelD family protein [Lachnospiraceae bacterium]